MTKQQSDQHAPEQWWGRYLHEDEDEGFTHGPYASHKDAFETMVIEGQVGDSFEVGRLVPFVPHVDAENLLTRMVEQSGHYDVPEDWPACSRPEDLAHLEGRLANVVQEWLAEQGLTMAFGDIEDVAVWAIVDHPEPDGATV